MRRALLAAAAVAAAIGAVDRATAHEGHEHKVMGKVVSIDEGKIEVEAKDGKKVSAVLTSETRYLRGKRDVGLADLKVGERVVIVVVEDEKVQKVKRVLLGEATSGPAREPRK